MKIIIKCFLLFAFCSFCTAQETEPMGDTDSDNVQDGSLNTNTVGSTSIQTGLVGYTKGSYQKDVDCNRRRDAKVLSDLGMKVAAIARMCEDHKVWRSLFMSATPCPLLSGGRLIVGRRAFQMMKMNPQLHIPDYGEVRMRVSATWSKKPPTPRYNDTQKWYNSILQIGADENEEQVQDGDDSESVSDKFRSSIK